MVGCPVADTGDGIGLSPTVAAAVAEAVRTVPPWSRPAAPRRWADMCLGIPGQVVEMSPGYGGQLALVEVEGATRR